MFWTPTIKRGRDYSGIGCPITRNAGALLDALLRGA